MHVTRRLTICFAVLLALAGTLTASARAMDVVRLHADHITFYYDRRLIEADGNVRVTTADGLTITGETFSMDLNLDRFLVAGAVHLTSPTGTQDGAAAADYFDFKRVYFVPITTEPDRWTFINGDYAHPVKGLQMPGDPFEFPDLSNTRPYLTATSATIGVGSYARFGGVALNVFGAYTPLGTYYVSFTRNPYLAQNSLAGANYDATWNAIGNANSISSVHFRYDTVNKAYVSFEQHFASSNAYAVFSVNPATKESKYWDLNAGWQLPSQRLQLKDFTQLHTFQSGLTQPLEAQHVSNLSLAQVLGTPGSRKDGTLSLSYQLVNYCLLQAGYASGDPNEVCGAPNHRAILQNMQTWQLAVASNNYWFTPYVPLTVSGTAGYGLFHGTAPLQTFGGASYSSIWNHFVGGTLMLNTVRIGDPNGSPYKRYTLNASLKALRTWYSVPHHVDSIAGVGSVSREFTPAINAALTYSVVQTNDIYNAGQQAAYPSYTPTIGGAPVPSYAAFAGKATQRTLSLQFNYEPSPDFNFSIIAQHHRDFPVPVPGLFTQPPTDVLGQYEYTNYLGAPPYDITGNVYFRISRNFTLDIARTYFFNFGTQKWSPAFLIQVGQGH